MTDTEPGQDTDPTWIEILAFDAANPLMRYCITVAALAIGGWFLVQMLTP